MAQFLADLHYCSCTAGTGACLRGKSEAFIPLWWRLSSLLLRVTPPADSTTPGHPQRSSPVLLPALTRSFWSTSAVRIMPDGFVTTHSKTVWKWNDLCERPQFPNLLEKCHNCPLIWEPDIISKHPHETLPLYIYQQNSHEAIPSLDGFGFFLKIFSYIKLYLPPTEPHANNILLPISNSSNIRL